MSSVTEMRFKHNMWRCDCNGLQTKRWLVQHQGVISDWRQINCTHPDRLTGATMLTLPDDQFICGDPPNMEKLPIAFSIVGTLSACVVFMILPMIIYIKRVRIYKTFKWHPMDWDECQGENSEFDIFVSYANEDEEFVGDYLIPVLLSHGFKVCFHRIHFLPGTPILTNIEQAVSGSDLRRAIALARHRAPKCCTRRVIFSAPWSTHKQTRSKESDFSLSYSSLCPPKESDLSLSCHFQNLSTGQCITVKELYFSFQISLATVSILCGNSTLPLTVTLRGGLVG